MMDSRRQYNHLVQKTEKLRIIYVNFTGAIIPNEHSTYAGMISIIICSRSKTLSKSLLDNIESTIGCQHEIIPIDNSEGKYSICSAYNEAVRLTHGEYLCFMHEDIRFLKDDWGKIASRHFSDPDVGMVGVLGCSFFDECMTYWCFPPFYYGHNWVGRKHKIFGDLAGPKNAVVIDGLWMLIRKSVFESGTSWDEETLTGFDYYDVDMSLQIIRSGKRIIIDPDIHINHFSNGNYSENFYRSCLAMHEKWDSFLPVSAEKKDLDSLSKISRNHTLRRMCEFEKSYYRNSNRLYKKLFTAVRTPVHHVLHLIKKRIQG